MASETRIPSNIDAIEAEMTKMQERLAALADAKRKALDEQRDIGRPVLLAALAKVRIGDISKSDARAIARAIERLGPARVAEVVTAVGA